MSQDALSKVILDSAFRVHSALGPGLFEHVYEVILAYELRKQHLLINFQFVKTQGAKAQPRPPG